MDTQLGFYVDIERCIGCRACEVACKQWNELDVGPRWRRVTAFEGGIYPHPFRYTVSLACNHCEHPACLAACPIDGAIIKRGQDGVVLINQAKCIGCRRCEWACPYGAPQFNPELGIVSKCHFCLDRQAEGLEPACVETCPAKALDWGKLSDLEQKYGGERQIIAFGDPALTNPSVRFNPVQEAMPLTGE